MYYIFIFQAELQHKIWSTDKNPFQYGGGKSLHHQRCMCGNKCIIFFHTFCLILFWRHLSCLRGLTQRHRSLWKRSTGTRVRCITIMAYQRDLRANKPPDTKPGAGVSGWFPAQLLHRHSQDKENVCPFGESVTVSSTINILLYVRSLNSKTLILQPVLQIHPQKLTHTVCKQRSLSVCSGGHRGRLETNSNTNRPALDSWVKRKYEKPNEVRRRADPSPALVLTGAIRDSKCSA